MQISIPNMPETLTYAVLASVGVDIVLAILLAVRGDWLGVVLLLALGAGTYWFLGRHLTTVVSAACAAGVGAAILLLSALTDIVSGHPYYGILFILATAVLGFVFVLLRQGARPAELKVGGIAAIDVSGSATFRAMLAALRDAGILSADEYAAKLATLQG